MSDFYQTGVVATFHRLGPTNLDKIEEELSWYAVERPLALILPSLLSELDGEALKGIVRQLKDVRYLREIVVTLGPASEVEFQQARQFFSALPQQTTLIWNSGPRVSAIYEAIRKEGLHVGEDGKGRSVWMAYGYILARQEFHGIVLHDCDIVSYSRDLLARLCYPVINPNLDYNFCKGFYSRVTDRLHGRVTRLLVTPLIRSLHKIVGHHPLLLFFDSFRYPLAGEFAMDVDLARINRIPADWGLEVGVLAEVYRNTALRRVCQIDIAENYEHKHQVLSADDSGKGLNKMCIDICKSLFRTLASEGVIFSDGFFKTLVATYVRTAQDMLKRFEDDAAVNGLFFDRHAESLAVETFTHGIREAAEIITEDPLGVPLITSWDRVSAAIPGILEQIQQAVADDNG
ncbi:MAG: glycosyl transferase [Desulfuromonadales bacterium GWD2_61_12]|nr:MAG: glycosyl transferase [Desulfuromonadales bacterium GWC2_61_20]OGR34130.1 MAG: glycosyl transferase [Desulfuromonadales bacterium GWD2_61_12]HAD04531.1 glycosyl transferase [Desulfuromonas sp.]HBT83443.1 glycosyl transferase [Desulfuromonas sp.]